MESIIETGSCAACDLGARLRKELDVTRRVLRRAEEGLSAAAARDGAAAPPIELVRVESASRREIAGLELVLLDIDCGHGDSDAA